MRQRFYSTIMIVFSLAILGKSTAAQTATAPASAPASKRLLVIAPARFHVALKDYVNHKRQALAVDLVSLEQALADKAPIDDPERLKRFVFAAWKEHAVDYLLLVGDADVLPVRYMVLDRVTPPAFDYAFYPSDLYYADLAKPDGRFEDWNAIKDGFHSRYFGEVRGEKNKKDPINYDAIGLPPGDCSGTLAGQHDRGGSPRRPEDDRLRTVSPGSQQRSAASGLRRGGWMGGRSRTHEPNCGSPAGRLDRGEALLRGQGRDGLHTTAQRRERCRTAQLRRSPGPARRPRRGFPLE